MFPTCDSAVLATSRTSFARRAMSWLHRATSVFAGRGRVSLSKRASRRLICFRCWVTTSLTVDRCWHSSIRSVGSDSCWHNTPNFITDFVKCVLLSLAPTKLVEILLLVPWLGPVWWPCLCGYCHKPLVEPCLSRSVDGSGAHYSLRQPASVGDASS